jgi:caa(3)-type oxidase subunit IV
MSSQARETGGAVSAEGLAQVRRDAPRIFAALVAFTVVEVAVSRISAARGAVVVALLLLACAKGLLVGLYFMHLRHETRVLRWTVILPLAGFGLYGAALVVDAIWRALG